MKATIKYSFTDIVDGDSLASVLMAGDEIDVVSIKQHCPDLRCCEVEVAFRHADIQGRVVGLIYFDSLGNQQQIEELRKLI